MPINYNGNTVRNGFAAQDNIAMSYNSCFYCHINWTDMTAQEYKDLRRGKLELRAVKIGQAIYFLFKFGSQDWIDAPFTACLSQGTIEKIKDETSGYAMVFLFKDPNKGDRGGRLVSMSNQMSKQVYAWMQEQLATGYDPVSYYADLDTIYRRYSTKDLVRLSHLRTVFDRD